MWHLSLLGGIRLVLYYGSAQEAAEVCTKGRVGEWNPIGWTNIGYKVNQGYFTSIMVF